MSNQKNAFINIHMIQNHVPSNLNRDDLGAPKTCYFGGVLRSRISSQSLKRSIRRSEQFKELLGGVRTRRLAELIANEFHEDKKKVQNKVEKILDKCGIKASDSKSKKTEDDEESQQDSKMLVYTTIENIKEMAKYLKENMISKKENELAKEIASMIANKTTVPDMALTGRMLEPDKAANKIWKPLNQTVEASLQAAHAISTHEARPEVDYFVAADDIPGSDAGAGYLDEAMFSSACYYKYFSINWNQLVKNLKGNKNLAAHTVGAFLRAAAMSTPSGKQNSFAALNPPDGILVELTSAPVSYANAFAEPVSRKNGRGIEEQSIAQLAQYSFDLRVGYGKPLASIWYSENLRFNINDYDIDTFEKIKSEKDGKIKLKGKKVKRNIDSSLSLEELTAETIKALSNELSLEITWEDAKKETIDHDNRLNTLLDKIKNVKNEEE